jgi:hypothetical protein
VTNGSEIYATHVPQKNLLAIVIVPALGYGDPGPGKIGTEPALRIFPRLPSQAQHCFQPLFCVQVSSV